MQVAMACRLMRERVQPALPRGYGACLMVFPFGCPPLLTYISNADRPSMKLALKTLLDKWESEAAAGEGSSP